MTKKACVHFIENNTSKTDVAPWCYKWTGWTGSAPVK